MHVETSFFILFILFTFLMFPHYAWWPMDVWAAFGVSAVIVTAVILTANIMVLGTIEFVFAALLIGLTVVIPFTLLFAMCDAVEYTPLADKKNSRRALNARANYVL